MSERLDSSSSSSLIFFFLVIYISSVQYGRTKPCFTGILQVVRIGILSPQCLSHVLPVLFGNGCYFVFIIRPYYLDKNVAPVIGQDAGYWILDT